MTNPDGVGEILAPTTLATRLDTIFAASFGSITEEDPDRIDISSFPPNWAILHQVYQGFETLQLSASMAEDRVSKQSTIRLVGIFFRHTIQAAGIGVEMTTSDLDFMDIYDDREICRGPVRYRLQLTVLD
ncbi:hypothetical protein HY346_03205, partial [Candidatus Microgenomates bacterium]|nr:hypothetical protein [Candidatus Microgenomates bacterium]